MAQQLACEEAATALEYRAEAAAAAASVSRAEAAAAAAACEEVAGAHAVGVVGPRMRRRQWRGGQGGGRRQRWKQGVEFLF